MDDHSILPSSVHYLLSKAFSFPLYTHLFPTSPLTLPSTTPPLLTPVSVTTDNASYSFNLLLTTTASHSSITFGEGLVLAQGSSQAHFRFARDPSHARAFEAYHLPSNDTLLLLLSQGINNTEFRTIKALFRRSQFLNLLHQQSDPDRIPPQFFVASLLNFTTETANRVALSESVGNTCTVSSSSEPCPNGHLFSDIHASFGHFDVFSTKLAFPNSVDIENHAQHVTARTSFTMVDDPILARRLASTQRDPLVEGQLHNLSLNNYNLPASPTNRNVHDDIVPLIHTNFEDSLVEISDDFLAAMDPGIDPTPDVSNELEGLELLSLPPPMPALAGHAGAGSSQLMEIDRPARSSEGLLHLRTPPASIHETNPVRQFSSPSEDGFERASSSGPDMPSLPDMPVPSQAMELSSSQSVSPANHSSMEYDDPREFAQKLKVEIRKQRNRASALRSNMKKRAIRDAIKMELKHCQEKIELLRSRELLLRQENMKLRKRLVEDSGIVSRIVANSLAQSCQ